MSIVNGRIAISDFGNVTPLVVTYRSDRGTAPDNVDIALGDFPKFVNIMGWTRLNFVDNTAVVHLPQSSIDTLLNSLGDSDTQRGVYVGLRFATSGATFFNSPLIFTIEQSEQTAPTVNRAMFSKTGLLPAAFDGLFVQNKSKAVVQMSATGNYGATITSIVTTLDGNTYNGDDITSDIITGSGTLPVVTTVTDSRGMVTVLNENISVYAYSSPKITAVNGESAPLCYRSDSLGNDDEALGEFVWLKAKQVFTSIMVNGVEKNPCRMSYRYKTESATSWPEWIDKTSSLHNNEYKGQVNETSALLTTVYIYQVKVKDAIGDEAVLEFRIATAEVALHLNQGGTAVGIGRYADDAKVHSLSIGWKTYFDEEIYRKSGNAYVPLLNGIIDAIYPVGSIYMSVNNTDPSVLFGGTWEQIEDKFLLASGSTYAAGSTGGEATHTLSVDEMPSHGHTVMYYGSSGNVGSWGYNYTSGAGRGKWSGSTEPNTSGISLEGGSQAHNNMPPYLSVNVWKRTA